MNNSTTVIYNKLKRLNADSRTFPLSLGDTRNILGQYGFRTEGDGIGIGLYGKDFIVYPIGEVYPIGRYSLPKTLEQLAELIDTLEQLEIQMTNAMMQ